MNTDDSRRTRRRNRRLVAIGVFLAVALTLAWFFEQQATTTVFVVRYAEPVSAVDDGNPGLSAAGVRRAKELARVLGEVNVFGSVDAVIATEFRSSQETAEPIAKALELPVQIVEAKNVRGLRDLILADYKGDMVLVITTRDSMTRLIGRMNGRKNLPPIEDEEFDNLYVVTIPWYGQVNTLGLKYGKPYVP